MPQDIRLGLNPTLVVKVQQVLSAMDTLGHPMRIVQGVRTADQQHALYLQGRDPAHPGPVVTNADGILKKSNHQPRADGLGAAVDCAFCGPDPWAETHPWSLYGAAVRAVGLVWGGDWVSIKDRPHAELPPDVPKS